MRSNLVARPYCLEDRPLPVFDALQRSSHIHRLTTRAGTCPAAKERRHELSSLRSCSCTCRLYAEAGAVAGSAACGPHRQRPLRQPCARQSARQQGRRRAPAAPPQTLFTMLWWSAAASAASLWPRSLLQRAPASWCWRSAGRAHRTASLQCRVAACADRELCVVLVRKALSEVEMRRHVATSLRPCS